MTITKEHIQNLFNKFESLNIMIIGDVMIDSYLNGVVERMSPEAPVPVVLTKEKYNRLGGAANVALNIKAMNATPILCSVIGHDDKANDLVKLMNDNDLLTDGLIHSSRRKTTVKTRVIGNSKQLLRVDDEDTFDLDNEETSRLIDKIKAIITQNNIDAIILQDYNKGVLTTEVIKTVVAMAQSADIPVAVDPKKKNFHAYQHVTLFKPNAKELREGMNITHELQTVEEHLDAASLLQDTLQCQHLMVTLSEKGVIIRSKNTDDTYSSTHLPAHLRSIADVSGAGDTVLSLATLSLAAHEEPFVIAALSNIAGGLVCEKIGVVPISRHLLQQEVERLYS